MSKGGDVSVSQNVDPRTQAYVDTLRRTALHYAGVGDAPSQPNPLANNPITMLRNIGRAAGQGYQPMSNLPEATIDPALLQALQGYQGYADIGKLGLTALSGGENPWMAASNPVYSDIRRQTLSDIGSDATLSGAFGGDRQAVAGGEALSRIGMGQAADAYNQAARAAGLGLAGLSGQSALAQYIQEYPQLFAGRQLGILNAGMGPYGTTQTQHTSSDPFSQLLGIGTLFLPGGPLADLFKGGAAAAAVSGANPISMQYPGGPPVGNLALPGQQPWWNY